MGPGARRGHGMTAPEPAQPREETMVAEGAPVAPPASPPPLERSRRPGLLPGVLGVAVLVLAWAAYDSSREMRRLRAEVAQRLTAADESARRMEGAATGAQRAAREAESRVSAVESRMAESQSQQVALEALYQELARGRDDALLAEVEQSLAVAAQQLAIAGNVQLALVALQGAEARLARIERPPFAPLRRALAADIARLQALPAIDAIAIAQRLDRATALLESLTPAPGAGRAAAVSRPQAAAPDPEGQGWRAALTRIWTEIRGELRQMATVRRIDRDLPPLLPPEQAWFLRENLRLRLLSARLALLARDEAGFRGDLRAAGEWLGRHFDDADPAVAALGEMLAELARATVRIDLPGIGESLEAVRALRARQDRRP